MENGALGNCELSKHQKVLHTDVGVFLEGKRRHSFLILKGYFPQSHRLSFRFNRGGRRLHIFTDSEALLAEIL
jgi:hypothetical protein